MRKQKGKEADGPGVNLRLALVTQLFWPGAVDRMSAPPNPCSHWTVILFFANKEEIKRGCGGFPMTFSDQCSNPVL